MVAVRAVADAGDIQYLHIGHQGQAPEQVDAGGKGGGKAVGLGEGGHLGDAPAAPEKPDMGNGLIAPGKPRLINLVASQGAYRARHEVAEGLAPLALRQVFFYFLAGDIVGRGAGGLERPGMPLELEDMPVAHAGIKYHVLPAEFFIQGLDNLPGFFGGYVPAGIVGQAAACHGDQVAAEDHFVRPDGNAQAAGLDGGAPLIVYTGVVAQHRHAGAGAGGLHARRHGAGQAQITLSGQPVQVGGGRQLQAGASAALRQGQTGGPVDNEYAVFHDTQAVGILPQLRNCSLTRLRIQGGMRARPSYAIVGGAATACQRGGGGAISAERPGRAGGRWYNRRRPDRPSARGSCSPGRRSSPGRRRR